MQKRAGVIAPPPAPLLLSHAQPPRGHTRAPLPLPLLCTHHQRLHGQLVKVVGRRLEPVLQHRVVGELLQDAGGLVGEAGLGVVVGGEGGEGRGGEVSVEGHGR